VSAILEVLWNIHANLSFSFLDDNTNTELIRWSDDGTSFVVLDEDEFAKTLIPELFKHNNYASFVRQLNMYGFHKKVGLSDNSMKASENKRKTPSEYYNKYFRRGRPELLWLIQKPKNPPPKRTSAGGKDKSSRQGDSDDETKYMAGPEGNSQPPGQRPSAIKDLTTIPKTELASLRQELANLQQQQKVISTVMQQMKNQNEQFYRQATAFQDMHNRHENSINAILTFLATFYNRSLEGQSNFPDIFANAIPQNTTTQQGNVVDMGDFPEVEMNMPRPNQMGRTRRNPLLLGAPPTVDTASPVSPATLPSSARSTMSPRSRNPSIFRPQASASTQPSVSTPPIKTDAETPNMINDNQGMLSVINAANSASPPTGGSGLDFDSALQHMQHRDGNSPLTAQQRNDVLSMMSNMNTAGGASSNGNNALNNPQTPTMPSIPTMPASQEQLDLLQRMQDEQAAKVQGLAQRLQPLSPSGTIPGLYDLDVSAPPSDFNLDEWVGGDDADIDADNYFPNMDNYEGDLNGNFNFGFDGTNDGAEGGSNGNGAGALDSNLLSENDAKLQDLGGKVESLSSRATSPADSAKAGDDGGSNKRRKVAR
jgi:heat shock transcription factor